MNNKNTPTKDDNINQPKGNILQSVFYAVWTIVGIVVLIVVAVGVFGSDTWVENLNLADTTPAEVQPEQAPQQPAQPPEPTAEQLACVAEELGEDRLAELEQGEVATDEEGAVIQRCLQQ